MDTTETFDPRRNHAGSPPPPGRKPSWEHRLNWVVLSLERWLRILRQHPAEQRRQQAILGVIESISAAANALDELLAACANHRIHTESNAARLIETYLTSLVEATARFDRLMRCDASSPGHAEWC